MITPLEALERYGYHCNHYANGEKDYKIIETYLKVCEARIKFLEEREKENEKKLKALEIIRDKEPSIMRIRLTRNSEHFNAIMPERRRLTTAEYDILKEALS